MSHAPPLDPAILQLLEQGRAERAAEAAARTKAIARQEDDEALADSLWQQWLELAVTDLPPCLYRYANLERPANWQRWVGFHDLVVQVPGFHPVRARYIRDLTRPAWTRRNWAFMPEQAWLVDHPGSPFHAPTLAQALLLAQKEIAP